MAKRKYSSPSFLSTTMLANITMTDSQQGAVGTGGGTAYEQISEWFDDDVWIEISRHFPEEVWGDLGVGYDETDSDTWDALGDFFENWAREQGLIDW